MHQLSWRVCGILSTVLSHFPMWLSYREVLGWCWHLEAGELWKSKSVCQKKGQKTTTTARKAPSGLKFLLNVIGITRHRHPALLLYFFMSGQLQLTLINTRVHWYRRGTKEQFQWFTTINKILRWRNDYFCLANDQRKKVITARLCCKSRTQLPVLACDLHCEILPLLRELNRSISIYSSLHSSTWSHCWVILLFIKG